MSVPDPCSILTSGIFSSLAPSPADPPYSYSSLCTAVTTWNTGNPSNQIFMGATELDRRNELAAFLGHTLHESGNYEFPRESSPCGTTANADGTMPWSSGTVYCQPSGYSSGQGEYTDPYCSTAHTSTSDPDGCDCSPVAELVGAGYDANKLFFGRGPIQLSWNYNYIDAGSALNVSNLCETPDLVATDAAISWGTALWFWMVNTGAVGVTPHVGVATNGNFGQSLDTINGGLECNPSVTSHNPSIVLRLEKYCGAADSLGATLLSLDGCTDLQSIFDNCISTGSQDWGPCPSCDGFTATASPTTSPTQAPTSSPTTSPTASPTSSPTTSPTSNPSKSPSASPTSNPSKAPSANPTASPSKSPTSSPSKSPTASPSNAPTTASPSTSPTGSPSSSPSRSPTASPSNAPTTASPSTSPTGSPTSSPSRSPTASPSNAPTTASPSTSPTASPTSSPSKSPTASPSNAPTTASPSTSPTASPTSNPSKPPTASPSNAPTTGSPSTSPTASPTSSPSKSPTASPSNAPTTASPSTSPTASPTSNPSKSPTASPSNAPTTGSPSTSPTASPTSSPTSSASPTRNPTKAPSASPSTASPTKRPSNAPTRLPTKNPTNKPTLSPQTQVVEVQVTVKTEVKTTTVEVSSSLRLDNFTLPENPDEQRALLEAVSKSLEATLEKGLTDNQSVKSITILSVGGEPVNYGNRRLLDRILENNDGVIDWVAALAEETTVITKTDQNGNVVEVSLNGQDISVDDFANGGVANANAIGSEIVQKVAQAMVVASESNDFVETLTETVGIVAASLSTEVQAALSALVINVIVDSVATDLDQEISPAQESVEETSFETLTLPATTTVKIEGRITFSNTVIGQAQVGDFADKTETVIEDVACPGAGVRSCQASVSRVNGQPVSARLRRRSRFLQDSTSLVAEFELALVAICSTSDCSDAQSIGNALYSQATGDLLAAINDGSLVSALQAASQEFATLLANTQATINFSELVVALLAEWYPDWRGGSGTCKNDGNAPTYMKLLGTYYKPSLEACCSHYYSWDIFSCTGDAGSVPSGFFPNWGQTETKCLNSTVAASTLPDYMRNNPEQWLENDVESCCERHYNWAYNDCTVLSGGNPFAPATGKWYVNHQDEICQSDCPEEGGGTCGGLANAWDTLYESPAACCASQLSWIASATCEAQSTLMPVVGSSQWYVDWMLKKCVKDCDDSSDASCGGLANSWDDLYSSSSACCDRLWYISREECTV